MKVKIAIMIGIIIFSNSFGQGNEEFYPIIKGNLWGYIDKTGKTVIEPTFYSAGHFSDGLAPARLNGTYGYIDKTGNFIIQPKYDLALPFENGQAKVFIEGKPFFINKNGIITFQHNYKSISLFENRSIAIVVTKTDKFGAIDKSGKLIIDTIYKRINPFIEGMAIVTGLSHDPNPKDTSKEAVYEKGVIDTSGLWIVKYGRYKDIKDFKNGYAVAELLQTTKIGNGWSNHEALIDKQGKQRFIFPSNKYRFDYDNEGYYDNVAVVSIYSVDVDTMKEWSSDVRTDYMGVINPDGKILFSDTSWIKLTPFSSNRAFAFDGTEKWKLIDKIGKQVGDSTFDEIIYETRNSGLTACPFQDGVAFVKLNQGWYSIDTTGKILSQPIDFDDVQYREIIRRGKILFIMKDISVQNPRYSFCYGFFNTTNNTLIKPAYHDIDLSNFNENLKYVMQDGRMSYITSTGKQIWKEENVEKKNDNLNIDFMNRGYFYASSKYKKELAGYGGWGGSDNKSKSISSDIKKSFNQLQVIIDTNKKTIWADTYKAMKLFLVNASKQTIYFDAQDSRLYLNLQAKDKNGEWKDIEYLPSSWCGNSYHTLFLASNELWEFSTPIYQGEFKTKIRAQLLYKKSKEQVDSDIIYSNEIDGYINPGQFWNKREYYPRGIMDPYDD